MLEKSLRRNSLCRNVTDYAPCENRCCEFQHKDSIDHFNNSFHSMLNFVYLESVISQGVPGICSNKEAKDLLQLKDTANKEYPACQRFYDFLFPLSGCRKHHLPNVRDIRMTKAVKNRLLQYALFLWKKADKEERRTDTNNFLKVSSLLQLTQSSQTMMTLICKEDEDFERMASKLEDKSFQSLRNGMVLEQEDSCRYESYQHLWERGKKRLYVYGEVQHAAHLIIRRFLNLPAKRTRMILPSIANTVTILEHQMTACLALFARLRSTQNAPVVCLPESYLTMVKFWDTFRPVIDTRCSFTMFEAVDFNVRNEGNKDRLFRAISSILIYLVELTCGEVSSSFDVIGDAISLKSTTIEEAERTFVFFLTMLCNCGFGIPISSEKVLLKKLLALHPSCDLPNRLKNELGKSKEVKGYSDVVKILKGWLLETRGEELLDLRWRNHKLWRDGPSNPSNYGPKFDTDISTLQGELEQSQLQVKEEANREVKALDSEEIKGANVDATEETMEVELTAEERQEKDEARSKIIDIEEVEIPPERKLLGQVSIEDRTSMNVLEDHFSRFTVDMTACTICGITFKSSAEERALVRQDEEFQEGSKPVFQEGLDGKEEIMETAETHQKSQAHRQKELEFQEFKNLYAEEIYPNLMKYDEVSSSTERLHMKDVGLDLDRLERSRNNLFSALEKIESSRCWTETALLLVAVQDFKAELEKTSPILEQAKSDSLPQGHEEYEADTVESQDEDRGYEDEIMPEEVNPKQKKLGKSRRRNRKR
ncbi:PREDICTED: TPR and ankyrin repeat-containing protein 1-like [Acropora digitifera]|uniref:TPR and ankyrin repeat-containing protein 1-like n=1 Tax=Acropora digitifera TaxID=70779 RepID=UPI00077A3F5F|nr:PREDICTED: TPR and ankyrin repeat-containing protein 1-like [Acropora digitifera]